MKSQYEICFPTIPQDLSKDNFINMLEKLNFGIISNVNITKHKTKGIYSGFVKYKNWDSVKPNHMKQELLKKKSIYIIYDFPNYLKCSLFK